VKWSKKYSRAASIAALYEAPCFLHVLRLSPSATQWLQIRMVAQLLEQEVCQQAALSRHLVSPGDVQFTARAPYKSSVVGLRLVGKVNHNRAVLEDIGATILQCLEPQVAARRR
jgi:hypothetical protein